MGEGLEAARGTSEGAVGPDVGGGRIGSGSDGTGSGGAAGEDLAVMSTAGGDPEAMVRPGGDIAAVEGSGDTAGSRVEAVSSGGGITGTPATPTVEDLLAAMERARDE